MAKKLTNLKITKVSLVDEGACSAAHITLFKHKKGGKDMTFEELMKSLNEEQQAVIKAKLDEQTAELTKTKEKCSQAEQDLEKAEQEKKDLETKVSELEGEVEKSKQKQHEPSEEEVLKNVDPAVREIIQKAKSEAEIHKQAVLKMKEASETAELTNIAKSLTGVGTEETQMVSMLRKAKSLDSELYNEVLKALETANNIIADSELLKEKGQSGHDDSVDAWAKVDAKADEIAKSRNISKAKATTVVIEEFPQLYQEYLDSLK